MAEVLENRDYNSQELHDEMYTILKELGLKPQKAFQAIYKMIIGKNRDPEQRHLFYPWIKILLLKDSGMNLKIPT